VAVQNLSKLTMQLAVLIAAGGFLLLVLAWNGAANLDYVQGQIPYLISGGLAGVALVGVGLTLALVMEIRRAGVETAVRLEQIGELLAGGLGRQQGPTAVPRDGSAVVAGRTTYHQPSCRLVDGRTDLQVMGPDAAAAKGLAACRICEPPAVATG
jgi:hypothetical protein